MPHMYSLLTTLFSNTMKKPFEEDVFHFSVFETYKDQRHYCKDPNDTLYHYRVRFDDTFSTVSLYKTGKAVHLQQECGMNELEKAAVDNTLITSNQLKSKVCKRLPKLGFRLQKNYFTFAEALFEINGRRSDNCWSFKHMDETNNMSPLGMCLLLLIICVGWFGFDGNLVLGRHRCLVYLTLTATDTTFVVDPLYSFSNGLSKKQLCTLDRQVQKFQTVVLKDLKGSSLGIVLNIDAKSFVTIRALSSGEKFTFPMDSKKWDVLPLDEHCRDYINIIVKHWISMRYGANKNTR